MNRESLAQWLEERKGDWGFRMRNAEDGIRNTEHGIAARPSFYVWEPIGLAAT
jgi:hypothetical protein